LVFRSFASQNSSPARAGTEAGCNYSRGFSEAKPPAQTRHGGRFWAAQGIGGARSGMT
jgi:hypothetical protein